MAHRLQLRLWLRSLGSSERVGRAAVAVSSLLPMRASPGLTKRWVVILYQRISVGPVIAAACEQLHPAGALA
jgi:hypothetical protein